MSKPVLGRGLSALLGGGAKGTTSPSPFASPPPKDKDISHTTVLPSAQPQPPPAPGTVVRRVLLDRVFPSPLQPRKDFTVEALAELADSIREQGIVQPLIVRASGDRFELIAGERRWRAARMAGLTEVPVVERVATDRELLELALIENLQRENLNPIEEALGYSQLGAQFELTQEQIAQKVGRGRVAVANALRLLKLPPSLQGQVRLGTLSVGHAKVLLSLSDAGLQASAAERITREGLTVRQLEELVARWTGPKTPRSPTPPAPTPPKDPHVADLENRLRERFATRVALKYHAGAGSVELRFGTDAELNRILGILGLPTD